MPRGDAARCAAVMTDDGEGQDSSLAGDSGNDTYNDGIDGALDTIPDTGGQGTIFLGGQFLTGGTATWQTTTPASWYGADLTYRRDGNEAMETRSPS